MAILTAGRKVEMLGRCTVLQGMHTGREQS
jgi:hypothetical protein